MSGGKGKNMNWFQKYIAHPFVAAVEELTTNPAITANPDAAKAVADAKAQAQAVAATTSTAAVAVISDAQTAADPAIAALGNGLASGIDAYLTAAIGPVGEAIVAPAVNVVLTLGEQKAHDLVTALFSHARSQLKAA